MKTLTDAEKRFIDDGIREQAPGTFIAHHIWVCRQLKVEPQMKELDELSEQLSAYVLGDEVK